MKRVYKAIFLICLVGIVVYSNSFMVPFQLDDARNINQNTVERFRKPLQAWSHNSTRFLTDATFALQYSVHQDAVFGYHAVNLIIHILNSILVFLIIRKLLQIFNANKTTLEYIALISGLLFVTHPIQTQAVTYIVQRYTSLATFWFLAAFYLYLLARSSTNNQRISKIIGIGVCFALGVHSKIIVVTFPAVLLLTEFILFRSRLKLKQIGLAVGSIALALVIFSIRFPIKSWIKNKQTIDGDIVTPVSYALTQSQVVLKYIGLLLVPVGQSVDHDVLITKSFSSQTLINFGLIFSMLGVGLFLRKRRPLVSLGILWFFVTLSIESSIFPIADVMFEHRLYLPSVGFFLCLASLLNDIYRLTSRRIVLVISFGLIVVYSGLTISRNSIWRSPVSLWADAVSKAPQKVRPRLNYAAALQLAGNSQIAKDNYYYILELDSKKHEAWSNLASIYVQEGDLKTAQSYYHQAIELDPDYIDPYVGLGVISMNQNNFEMARNWFEQAAQIGGKNHPLVKRNSQILEEKMSQ